MVHLGTRLVVALALVATLAACSDSDDEPSATQPSESTLSTPSTTESSAEAPPADPFYPDDTGERILVDGVDYVDPCHLLTIAEARRFFGISSNVHVSQERATHTVARTDFTATCEMYDAGYELAVKYLSGPDMLTAMLRADAHDIGGGLWFFPFNDESDGFDGSRDPSKTHAIYRFRFDQGLIEFRMDVPHGQPDDYHHPSARKVVQLLRKRLKHRDELSQAPLGPVLRGQPVAAGTPIADACDLLSPEVLTGLAGNDDHNLIEGHDTNRWHHEGGYSGDPKDQWSAPRTLCEWGTGWPDIDSPRDTSVYVTVRSHPDVKQAHRIFTAVTDDHAPVDSLQRFGALDLDEGGWLTRVGDGYSSTTLHFRVGRYAGSVKLMAGENAPVRKPGEMIDAANAMMQRLRDLGAE